MSYPFFAVEWLEWKANPQTQEFLNLLRSSRQDIQDEWANRNYTAPDVMATIQLNSGALGSIDAITNIIKAIENIGADQ